MTDLIGKTATIVGYSEAGDRVSPDNEAVAHICLDIEDGPRVFFRTLNWTTAWMRMTGRSYEV